MQFFPVLPALLSTLCLSRGDDDPDPPPVYSSLAEWKQAMFSREALADGTSDDDASPAGDEIPNLLKYAFDLNPFDSSGSSPFTEPDIENNHLLNQRFPSGRVVLREPSGCQGRRSGHQSWVYSGMALCDQQRI